VLTPILATLVYVVSADRSRVLMLHRNKRIDDIHFGKYNGLGGKVEPDEDVVSGAIREVAEESGLAVTAISLRGTVSWPGFGPAGQDWFGFVFSQVLRTTVAPKARSGGCRSRTCPRCRCGTATTSGFPWCSTTTLVRSTA
jgi:8-oxo-dGTP pyrophosphatase MutT (NUDIX family)